MSKAEERALAKYPLMADNDKEALDALKYIGMECDCASEYNEVQESKQAYFIEGYEQAEKDLELTWKDIELIVNIDKDTDNEESIIGVRNNKEHYQEVLERFKDFKERKEK